MNFAIREGKMDVAIAAGPHVEIWPSIGVRTLSVICAEMGLTVGQLGGDHLTVRGVIPLPSTGGIVLVEDIQKRIHRIRARAVVRIHPEELFPNPFIGWQSPGLIPVSTAERLLEESQILWEPTIVILGTGNRALRFGSALLDRGTPEVFCVEPNPKWRVKRFAGWEVERRRFEIAGGKMIEARPVHLQEKSPLLWQLKLQDTQGVRILEVGRVVAAGPFSQWNGTREYPPGSSLYEMRQTARLIESENIEGWALEEERGRFLASKIIKSLVHDLQSKKDEYDQTFKKAKARLKRYFRHQEEPFTPTYQGKWINVPDAKKMRQFSGVPQGAHLDRAIASVECFEEIPCHVCQDICPTKAIQTGPTARHQNTVLNQEACISCGLCLVACPTSSIPMIHDSQEKSHAKLTLPWRGSRPWIKGEFAILLNRRGESLGTARVAGSLDPNETHPQSTAQPRVQLVQLDVPSHLVWEARGLKRARGPSSEDKAYLAAVARSDAPADKVDIAVNGEKRLVRDKIPISIALFETGQNRPEDSLFCRDGSCGLCLVQVDGIKKLACQTKIHRGMSIRIPVSEPKPKDPLCPCLNISQTTVIDRLKNGKLQSPEAVLSVTQVGGGKCHGQLCMGAFKRLLNEQGLPIEDWIDWRFPWSDWILPHN